MTPEAVSIHSIDDRLRERLTSRAQTRMASYPLTSGLIMAAVEKSIRNATDWRGLIGSYVRAAAAEGEDLPALGFLETGLSDLKGVEGIVQRWIDALDRRLVKGQDMILTANKEGLPEYPFGKVEVKYEWGMFGVAASGVARILTGDERRGVALELTRLDHLARLVSAISKAYRQLGRCRGGTPELTDQVRVYQCIPWNQLAMLEEHEAKNVLLQIKSILDAWGISELLEVRLSAN